MRPAQTAAAHAAALGEAPWLACTVLACAIGTATAYRDGIEIDATRALLVAFAALAVQAVLRIATGRGGGEPGRSGPLIARAELLIAPALVLLAVAADVVQRGAAAWPPLAASLSFALLVSNMAFIARFADHARDSAANRRTLVVRLGPDTAKWAYFGLAVIAYGWLVLQVGRDNLPQGCAAAAFTLVLSFSAARDLREYATEPDELGRARLLTTLAALAHGVLLAGALALDPR